MKNFALIIVICLTACISHRPINQQIQSSPIHTEQATASGDSRNLTLRESDIDTLQSLKQIDDYPLYVMDYFSPYDDRASHQLTNHLHMNQQNAWACSLFTVFSNTNNKLFARNFDWEFSPALLLYTDPPDGYASASMVDIAYLGFSGNHSANLTEKPLDELVGLLDAPYLPFDGINEAGLVVGMAAVPDGNVPSDPQKDTLGSLGIIRVVLDKAANVDEALDILQNYNIDFDGGPTIHYLLSDTAGNAVLFEHYQGEVHIIRNQSPWHLATNFLNASFDSPEGKCWRYDTINETLEEKNGNLNVADSMNLLEEVSQEGTQWSVVYDSSRGEINVVMGRNYDNLHVFPFNSTTKK